MPNATEPTPAEQLADLLDGRLSADEVPAELAELAELATAVRTHVTLVPPTDAFREALRDQVVRAASGPAVGGATAAGGTATGVTATGASGGIAGVIAGVAAAAVLAASTVTVADRAGPGDLLAGVDRGIESLQLLVADDARDAELLVDFASERVLEALDLTDVAVVRELLDDADALVADAVALAVAQGRSVDDLLTPYVGALLTLLSRTDDAGVAAAVTQRLDALGVQLGSTPSGDAVTPTDEGATPDDTGTPDGDEGTGADAPTGTSDDPTGGATDDVTDPLDDVTDPLDDVTDPLDDVTDPLDDVTDPLDDVTDPLDDVTDPLDDVTDPLDDATDPLLP